MVERARFTPFLFSWPLVLAHFYFLLRKPGLYCATLATLIRANLGSRRYLAGAIAFFPKAVFMARWASQQGITHIHAHFASHPAAVAFVIHRLTGIPYSFTAHGSDLHRDRHMLREKVAAAKTVVAISDYNREVILTECGADHAEKVVVIHCGVDTERFCPRAAPTPFERGEGPFSIVCTGSLHAVKGQRTLIEACRRLRQRGCDFICHFAGDGPDREQLETLSAQASLQDHVRFHGQLKQDELRKLLDDADVVAAPSVPTSCGRREGIPVALMEALGSGIAAVASRLSGIPELVRNEETGLLIPPGDDAALAEALLRLSHDADLRHRLATSGRAHVRDEFDLFKNAATLAAIFAYPRKAMLTPILFFVSAAVVVYAYAIFPALLLLRAVVWRKPYVGDDITPTVSMIICCYNEQDSIEGKLRNCLSLDYPREKFEIIVASDGSDDRTEAIVAQFEDDGVTLLSLPRGGKALALNTAVDRATGEVLVFSDANSMFASDAIGALVRPLADPSVGGVAGDQRYVKQAAKTNSHDGEQSYWNYDRWLKRAQSCAGSVTSATGAIYAIRRALFEKVPSGVTDDFVTSARVVAQGYRLVFAHEAIAYEHVTGTSGAEFRRKVRLMTRGLRGVLELRRLLNPFRYGLYSLQLFSHKVLRRILFLWLIALLATSLLLWNDGMLYQIAAIIQLLCYGCALIGTVFAKTWIGKLKPFSVPAFFVMANVAAMIATLNLIRGRKIDIWQPSRNDSLSTASNTA